MSDKEIPHPGEDWPKRKWSKCHCFLDHLQIKEEYLALCLVMLAHGESNGGCLPSSFRDLSQLPVTPQAQKRSYKCFICGKAFASYQALGSHMAIHQKLPGSNDGDKPAGSTGSPIVSTMASSTGMMEASNSGRVLQCSICLKTFPSC